MHAMDHGAKLTPNRIEKLSTIPGAHRAKIAKDGEITAEGNAKDLQLALWDALRLALAVSDKEVDWVPKTRQERFATAVAKSLKANLPKGTVLAKPRLTGVSGHQIEFPIGVMLPGGGLRVVQPIGISDEHTIDWGYIYQSSGKLLDLKRASREIDNRVVIMEEGASLEESSRAATVLAESARVLTFSDSQKFAQSLIAA